MRHSLPVHGLSRVASRGVSRGASRVASRSASRGASRGASRSASRGASSVQCLPYINDALWHIIHVTYVRTN